MTFTMEVPDAYGYVILGCAVLPVFTNLYMGGPVMKARSKFKVPYPNLYATPGYHKQADEFNRVQRGHQNMFEMITSFTALSLLGGIKHPIVTAVGGVFFCVGSVLFQIGYADTALDVKTARYKKGGMLKWIGLFLPLGTSISLAGSMIGIW
eukprot:CAMPEP_0194028224 /NCGR_PEP_ID=MMETSP0009_2-20130614/2257_1 /TAXON_ID=210454 /ORGANISM="Grammatophora oceanica, Strain CCMP 410" /LENGTH=151 /DNA_ID=CAMNT_0038667557 /DNA_START=69 /DNA_END=524 /DNA_ORIENTATION=+